MLTFLYGLYGPKQTLKYHYITVSNFPKQLLKLPTQRPSSLPWGPRPGPIEDLNTFFFIYHQYKFTAMFFSAHSTSAAHICWKWATLPFADQTFKFRRKVKKSNIVANASRLQNKLRHKTGWLKQEHGKKFSWHQLKSLWHQFLAMCMFFCIYIFYPNSSYKFTLPSSHHFHLMSRNNIKRIIMKQVVVLVTGQLLLFQPHSHCLPM